MPHLRLAHYVAVPVAILLGLMAAIAPAFAAGQADATSTACRTLRNNTPDVPSPPAPNRDDVQTAIKFNQIRQYQRAFGFFIMVDAADTKALSQLAATTPHIDMVINHHVTNLVFARSVLGDYLEKGLLGIADQASAVREYQSALDTKFIDDRGCVHKVSPSFKVLTHLAGMYAYGIGTPADRKKAVAVFKDHLDDNSRPIVTAIERDRLPRTYKEYLELAGNRMRPAGSEEYERWWWLNILIGVGIGVFLSVIAAYVVSELRARAQSGAGHPVGFYGGFDIVRAVYGRIDLILKGLIGGLCGIEVLPFFMTNFHFGFYTPQWLEKSLDYLMVAMIGLIIVHGVFNIIEALRPAKSKLQSQVHGAARPAPEAEAHAAAGGQAKLPDLHDRTFAG